MDLLQVWPRFFSSIYRYFVGSTAWPFCIFFLYMPVIFRVPWGTDTFYWNFHIKYPVFYMIMLQMLSICLIQLITLCLSHICRSNSPRSWRWCAFRHERGGSTPFVIHFNYFYFFLLFLRGFSFLHSHCFVLLVCLCRRKTPFLFSNNTQRHILLH